MLFVRVSNILTGSKGRSTFRVLATNNITLLSRFIINIIENVYAKTKLERVSIDNSAGFTATKVHVRAC